MAGEYNDAFNRVAQEYHFARPGYPTGIIDALVTFGQIPEGGRVLELGSGTGIATSLLAERGFKVTAVEPGSNLLAIACTQLEDMEPPVTFINSTFMDAGLSRSSYDAAVAATSWRWQGADRRAVEEKVHGLLKPGGHLGILQNTTAVSDGKGDYLHHATHPVFDFHGIDMGEAPPAPEDLKPDQLYSDLFNLVFSGMHIRHDTLTAEEYGRLVGTYGPIARLPKAEAGRLIAELTKIVRDEFGGTARLAHATTLTVAQAV